jgi:DNA-3-methyladenine glycosylase I
MPNSQDTRPATSAERSIEGRRRGAASPTRCFWAKSELAVAYHDLEWGVPQHDDRALFELLCLEGAQAGLSWETVLRKRDAYRVAFANFEPAAVARFDAAKLAALMGDSGIIRNRLKIAAAAENARACLAVAEEFGSFDKYLWRFVDGRPLVEPRRSVSEIPARSPLSDRLSKDLRGRGFKFVGSTICYSFMQAVGMVNDHLVSCFRYRELRAGAPARAKSRPDPLLPG